LSAAIPNPNARLLGEGLTQAAEALASGSDEVHLREAAEHLARSLGATAVAVLTAVRDGESLSVIADSDEHRSDTQMAALISAPALRDAMASGVVVVVPEVAVAPEDDSGPIRPPGTWAIFPLSVRRKMRGVLVARLPYLTDQLPDAVLLCGRAAAALVTVILPGAKVLEPLRERTRKTTLTDVNRERRLRAIERYRSFIDSASDGIVVLDTSGTVLYMNRAAEQVTGYARDGLAGKSWSQIVPEAHRPILWTQLTLATQSRPVENFDLDLVTTSGDRITVSVAVIFAFTTIILAIRLQAS